MKIERMATVVANHLQNTLDFFHWNKTEAARALDMDRRTIYRMVERYKLTPRAPEFDAQLQLRCDDCGSVSEPGEIDPRIIHTHSCKFAEAAQ